MSEQGNSSSEENPKTNRPENEDEEKFIINNLDHEDDQEISGDRFGVLVEARRTRRPATSSPSGGPRHVLLEVRVQSLALDRSTNTPVVILQEVDGE